MGKGLHNFFRYVVNDISQVLPIMGESGSEVSHLIPESRNFTEVAIFSYDIKKPWLKVTMKEIKNLINNQTFLVEDSDKGDTVTPCMDVYKARNQSDGSLDKLNLRILVVGDLKNK